jgi:tetratricopeptide (TPR) repeat protein
MKIRKVRPVRLIACLALLLAVEPVGAMGPQAPGAASVSDRLTQARTAIFSGPAGAKTAIPGLQAILAADPTVAEAHMLLGIAYRMTAPDTMTGEAKAELQQAIDLDPSFIPARLMLAQIYFDLGRYQNVKEEATIALTQLPGQPQFLSLLGESERQMGRPATAIADLRLALQADPNLAQAKYFLGLALIDAGQRDDAIATFEAMVRAGVAEADVPLHLGLAYLDADRRADAVHALELAVRLAPDRADTHIALARAYRLSGSLARAEEQLMLAGGASSGSAVTAAYQHTEASRWLEWGLLRLAQQQWPVAARALVQALEMDPSNGPAHRALAEVYVHQGDFARARAEARQSAALGTPVTGDLQRQIDAHPAAAASPKAAP